MQLNDRGPAKGRQSLILHWLHVFTAWLYTLILSSAVGRYLTGYRKSAEALEDGNLHRLFHSRKKRAERLSFRIRRWIAAMLEKSLFCRALRAMERFLLRASVNSYGIFFLFFGCYSIVTHYITVGFWPQRANMLSLYVGGMLILASLPLFASTRSLAYALRTGTCTSALLFRVFGMSEERFHSYEEKGQEHYLGALFASLIFGSVTFFVIPHILLGAICVLLLIRVILRDPEVGMLLSVAACPFMVVFDRPTLALAALVGMTLFSFVVKLLCGKRVLQLDLTDATVFLLLTLYLLGGWISHGGSASRKSAMVYALLMSIYFIIANLVRSRDGVRRVCGALMLSGTLVALVGLWQYFFSELPVAYLDLSLFADLGGRVCGTWENPNMLAEYLALLIPIVFARMLRAEHPLHGVGRVLSVALLGLCLIFTWSRGAWLGVLVALILMVLCLSHRALSWVILAILPAGVALPLLPEQLTRRFLSIGNLADSSVRYRVYLWEGVGKMLRDHWLGGVGVGEEAFCAVYVRYSLPGIETAMHAHSLYLQLWCQLGIVGLVAFALLILTWLRRALEFYRYSEQRDARLTVLGGVAAIGALLVMGLFDDVFYNYRIFFLFFAVMGLVTAQIRTGERQAERAYNPVDDERTQGEITFRFHNTL